MRFTDFFARSGWVGGLGGIMIWASASLVGQSFVLSPETLASLTGQTAIGEVYPFKIAGWGADAPLGLVPGVVDRNSWNNFSQLIFTPQFGLTTDGVEFGVKWVTPLTPPQSYMSLTNTVRQTAGTVALACGEKHTLLLKRDGTVAAVGSALSGQTAVPAGLSSVVAIAAGTDHSLALRADGSVVAWGWNDSGQTCVPADLKNVAAVAGGRDYSLALLDDGTVRAWGGGDVDDDYHESDFTPPEICRRPGLSRVTAIAAGLRHVLALRVGGGVIGWGSHSDRSAWTPPADLGPVVAIAAGNGFSVALRSDGGVRAWGDNRYGQLKVPPDLRQVVALSCGNYHTLALRADGTVVAWGDGSSGQTEVPAEMADVVAIAAGGFHSQALIQSAPPLVDPRVVGRWFSCELNLPAGRRYRLEASADLLAWTTVEVDTAFPSHLRWERLQRATGAAFYRVAPIWPGDPEFSEGYHRLASEVRQR